MKSLYEMLINYKNGNSYPFHMPGHKRNPDCYFENPFSWDITEIEGFDDLHHPDGILKEAMEQAASVYGSQETFFLINGSSCGLLAAISGTVKPGGKVLLARNCHKSVYHGALLGQMETKYVYPQILPGWGINGAVLPEDVDKQLEAEPEIQAVVITSPTYEGVVSNIEAIARAAHRHHVPLIVDEAHGAHFSFGTRFPETALKRGADIVVQSLHKTLPSLTQTGVLHIGKGSLVSREAIQKFLSVYQSSSPSYVLLASIDRCIRYMDKEGRERMELFYDRLLKLRKNLSSLKEFQLLEGGTDLEVDISKLYGRVLGRGMWLAEKMRLDYGIEGEMADRDSVLFMTSLMDTQEGFQRLLEGLKQADEKLSSEELKAGLERQIGSFGKEIYGQKEKTLSQGFFGEKTKKLLWDCQGEISGEFVYLYPPGIPILAPGERISAQSLAFLSYEEKAGVKIQGMEDPEGKYLKILKNPN